MKKELNRKSIRTISVLLFLVYICALAYFVFLSDGFSRVEGYSSYRYNLTPFLEIKRFATSSSLNFKAILVNLAGNVAAFMPFGALVRWVRNKKTGFIIAALHTFIFSFIIETIQLVTMVGVFDVDDLILNTLGGLLGYICYAILKAMNNKREKKLKNHNR